MAKFTIDFPMTIYMTETIEAKDEAEAKEIARKLLDSWKFFCERMYPDYQGVDLHENWVNCEDPEVIVCDKWADVTMDANAIDDFIE